MKTYLLDQGFEIAGFKGLQKATDYDIYMVSQTSLRKELVDMCASYPDVDGAIVSCSALRVLTPGFLDELERETGKPVVSSMQAAMWKVLRESGETLQPEGFGSLFRKH
jgi:maleate isomerase